MKQSKAQVGSVPLWMDGDGGVWVYSYDTDGSLLSRRWVPAGSPHPEGTLPRGEPRAKECRSGGGGLTPLGPVAD
jgi:hypothetical protein